MEKELLSRALGVPQNPGIQSFRNKVVGERKKL